MIIAPLVFSFPASSSGLLEDLESILNIQKTNYEQKLKAVRTKRFVLSDIKEMSSIRLDSDFMSDVLFNSPARYTSLELKDSCSLFDIFTTNLLNGSSGEIEYILFSYLDLEDKIQTRALKKQEFLKKIAFKICPGVATMKNYFLTSNLRKTLQTITLPTPKNYNECEKIHQDFRSDYKMPHLCEISETISSLRDLKNELLSLPSQEFSKKAQLNRQINRGNTLTKILKPEAQSYLSHLCLNLNSSKLFCDHFFETNFWKEIDFTKNTKVLESFCDFSSKTSSKAALESCRRKLETTPSSCLYPETRSTSLLPKEECNLVSKALSFSRLNLNYDDCPSEIGNEAVITMSRIISYMSGTKEIEKSKSCRVNATMPMANLDISEGDGSTWNINICYDDKIKNTETCLPTLLDAQEGSDLSLTSVVGKMMARLRGFDDKNQSCQIVQEQDFKPALLRFQTGCFVVPSKDNCRATSCPFKVYLALAEFKNFKFKSELNFDFFHSDYINESKSQMKFFTRTKKVEMKSIKSATALKRIFEKKEKTILAGVACLEQLLPRHFKVKAFNMCTPMPFIIDGYLEKDGIYSAVIRTSMDSLFAPRIIPWNYVFSALKTYQSYHPINLWGLYALY